MSKNKQFGIELQLTELTWLLAAVLELGSWLYHNTLETAKLVSPGAPGTSSPLASRATCLDQLTFSSCLFHALCLEHGLSVLHGFTCWRLERRLSLQVLEPSERHGVLRADPQNTLILVKQTELDVWRIDYYRTRPPHMVSPFGMWQIAFSPLHYVVAHAEGSLPEVGPKECLILDCWYPWL